MNTRFSTLFMALSLLFLGACSTKSVMVNGEKVELADGIYAKFNTTKGDILVKLNTEYAPMTSANFVMLAEGNHPDVSEEYKGKPFYNGLSFHRVIPDFMIQGGDPKGDGSGGPGYKFPNETSDSLKHNKGVISMANSGPNTNGCQFFITVKETPFLDGGYNVFGEVLAGQAVADSISLVPRDGRDKPKEPVLMNTVEIVRVGGDFKKWNAQEAYEKGKGDFDEKQRQAREAAEALMQEQINAIEEQYPNAQQSASGLRYIVHNVGSGPKPADGAMVNIDYTGYLANGGMFDTSNEEKAKSAGLYNPQRPYGPMPMEYGMQAQVIPGFKEGINMLNVGGSATLIIPPDLAYGERGAGNIIPPNSWLIFEVELVSEQ